MNLLAHWPSFVAAILAALVPLEGRAATKRGAVALRVGLAVVAFFAVWFVQALWPTEAMPEVGSVAKEWPHLLNLLVFAPIVGAVLVLFLPRQNLSLLRGFSYAVMALTFIASLWTLSGPMTEGWHY
ncbi:MAG TPA: hypothetical protein VHB21_05070, partial [Minicystis sp.]|nr:hypothetical protein [Minicystis sp.]